MVKEEEQNEIKAASPAKRSKKKSRKEKNAEEQVHNEIEIEGDIILCILNFPSIPVALYNVPSRNYNMANAK